MKHLIAAAALIAAASTATGRLARTCAALNGGTGS